MHQMMESNMAIVNEELGEISFSMLSRCVLGDTVKDEFKHMSKMYSLLPIFRDIKYDVMADTNVSTSLTWHHEIKPDSDEVKSAVLFFKKIIAQIKRGSYKVYSNDTVSFKSAVAATQNLVASSLNLVHMEKEPFEDYVNSLYGKIQTDMDLYALYRYDDVWPEAAPEILFQPGDVTDDSNNEISSIEDAGDFSDAPNSPEVDLTNLTNNEGRLDFTATTFLESDNSFDPSASEDLNDSAKSPYLRRTWNAWGNVSRENIMYGRRGSNVPEKYLPSKRRIIGGKRPH